MGDRFKPESVIGMGQNMHAEAVFGSKFHMTPFSHITSSFFIEAIEIAIIYLEIY